VTTSRRRFAATGVALALALTLGACTSGEGGGDATSKTTQVEGTVPLTVQKQATWKSQIMEGAPVQVTSLGVLTFSADKSVDGESYVPVLLHPEDGSARWTGKEIKSTSMPTLEWVQENDDRWAVAKTVEGNKASLYVWNGLASHANSSLVSSNSFEGKKKPPNVFFSGSGVLVTGADKTAAEPLVFWPKDASVTRYKGGPKRDGKAGTPIGAYGKGFLVSFKGGGFSFASPTGGWASTSVAPEDSNPQTGTVLVQGDGYIVSEWSRPSDQEDGTTILAVHSATSGHLFAQYDVPKEAAETLEAQKESGAALVTDDARWLAWGQFGFNLSTGEGALYDLEQGVPTAIIDGLLYVRNAYSLIEPKDEETASASPEPSESAESASPEPTVDPDAPKGFTGVTGIDLTTSQPLSGLPSVYPIGRTSTGQVILRDDTKQAIYSVGLR
jgi:hypothetical protein